MRTLPNRTNVVTSPRTFIARKRLDKALEQFRSSEAASKCKFTLHFEPYQLHPDFAETENKNAWYLQNKHMGNPEAQKIFQEHMNGLVEPLGAKFNFEGDMGNTIHAHRVLQHFQEENGPEVANKLVDGLYRRYFTEAKHPAADSTLIEACVEAGIDEAEAKKFVENKDDGLRDVKSKIRMISMDVDAVPVVMVEGRRRDITLTGAKEIADYVKTLETIAKESG